MNPKISVIIPVYNAEYFLPKCINSILNQTFSDFELILVNDGSKDRSLSICENFKKNDPRIIIVNQFNKGVSSARNAGLDRASSDYIIFIDADDYTDNLMLSELYSAAITMDSDIVFCDFYYTKYNIDRVVKINFTHSSSIAIQRILTGELQGFMCNKLVRRTLFSEHNIKFNSTITMGEDMLVMCQLLLQTKNISYIPKAFFHYVQHNLSTVALRKPSSFDSQRTLVKHFEILLNNDSSFENAINMNKIFVKKEMLLHGMYSNDEIINIYPEVNCLIRNYTSINIFEKKYFISVIEKSKMQIFYKLVYLLMSKIYSTKIAWKLRSLI